MHRTKHNKSLVLLLGRIIIALSLLTWLKSSAQEPLKIGSFKAQITANSPASRAHLASPQQTDDPAVYGQWSDPVPWPLTSIHASLLPDGRILTWDSNEDDFLMNGQNQHLSPNKTTRIDIYDPVTDIHIEAWNETGSDLFCSGHAHLPTGDLFVSGGTTGANFQINKTNIFNYKNDSWSLGPQMFQPRWYPSVTPLADGDMLLTGGRANIPEVYDFETGTVRQLSNVTNTAGAWPWLRVAPNGLAFYAGPARTVYHIDVEGLGTKTDLGIRDASGRENGSYVIYDIGKVLVAGGGASLATATVVDMNTGAGTPTGSMALGRHHHNLTVLADGSVMAVGGNTGGGGLCGANKSGYMSELWEPETGAWRPLDSQVESRQYHSTALLLPDGRVFSSGEGRAWAQCEQQYNAEFFSPPYLFNADGTLASRPEIDTIEPKIDYQQPFSMTIDPSSTIQEINLVRLGSVTHSNNQGQRLVPINFTQSGNTITAQGPQNANIAPPGHYMLFIIDDQGTPSVAEILLLGWSSVTIEPVVDQFGTFGANVDVPITAYDRTELPLTYTASGLPTGLAIDPQSGLISGQIAAHGEFDVTVTASNGTDSQPVSFKWHVGSNTLQVGTLTFTQPTGTAWFSVAFDEPFAIEPIVIFSPISYNGGDPSTMRVRNVTTTGFEYQLDEWDYRDGEHLEETVHYLAMVPGRHDFNGLIAEAGSILSDHWERSVDFSQSFATTPAVFAQVASTNETSAVIGRVLEVENSRFSMRLQEEEAADDEHVPETVHYIAFSKGQGVYKGLPIKVGSDTGFDEKWKSVQFSTDYQAPVFLAAPQSYIGMDPFTLRYRNFDGAKVDLRIHEEASIDTELAHTQESVAWLVMGTQAAALAIADMTSTPQVASTPIAYQPITSGGITPRYSWNFGDGTPPTAQSADPAITHTFAQPGRYIVTLTATDVANGNSQTITFVQLIHEPLTSNQPNRSGSIALQVNSGDNDWIWNVNPDNDTVTAFDTVTHAKEAELEVGDRPSSVAVAPNGDIWVTNKQDATISIIAADGSAVLHTIALPHGSQPHGGVFQPNGVYYYVVLEGTGQVVKIARTSRQIIGQVDVGSFPRHLSINGTGNTLYVSRFISPLQPGEDSATVQQVGGEIIVINQNDMSVERTITLAHSTVDDTEISGRGLPNYLGAPAISPDGLTAWVPSKMDNILRGTLRDENSLTHENTVRAISSKIDLASSAEITNDRIDHDNASYASASAYGPNGNYLFVALEGNRQVLIIDAYSGSQLFNFPVGRTPQGLTVSPDGHTLYVHNFMDRSISIHDLTSLYHGDMIDITQIKTYEAVSSETLSDQVLLGKQLFYDAQDTRLSLDSYMSCASCHSEGGHDGRVWDFTDVGEGLRNTISLQGHANQGPLHWSGNFDEVHDFEQQIRDFSGGTGLMNNSDFNATQDPLGQPKAGLSTDLDALVAYVNSLMNVPDSPYRQANGSLTAAGEAGREIFVAQGCATCHSGSAFTDSAPGIMHDIGTLKPSSGERLGNPLTALDTPTLQGLWMTAPYLHDGSALTLADAVNSHNNINLSSTDLTNLVAYLNQIDEHELAPAIPPVMTASANESALALSWTMHSNNCRYTVYTSTSPYSGFSALVSDLTGSSYDIIDSTMNNSAVNTFYSIAAQACDGDEAATSKVIGEFDFDMVSGE